MHNRLHVANANISRWMVELRGWMASNCFLREYVRNYAAIVLQEVTVAGFSAAVYTAQYEDRKVD